MIMHISMQLHIIRREFQGTSTVFLMNIMTCPMICMMITKLALMAMVMIDLTVFL